MAGAIASFVERELAASKASIDAVYQDSDYRSTIAAAGEALIRVMKSNGTLFFAGNGGSAADAQHIAGEFVSRFHIDRAGLPAISLSTDTSILTAVGNDYGFEQLFARQIEALARRGDMFVPISTSGNSRNILRGIEAAKQKGMIVVGLTGRDGGEMRANCDIVLCAPADSTPRIQECHLVTYHLLCGLVESALFGNVEQT